MIIEKFNLKAQECIESACRLAVKKGHAYVTPWHLLSAMLAQKSSPAPATLTQAGVQLEEVGAKIDGQLLTQPKATVGSQQTPISRDLESVLINAEEAAAETGDKYIGINHILLGMMQLEEITAALVEAGADSQALTLLLKQSPTGKYQGTAGETGEFEYLAKYARDVTERARSGELDPIIGRDDEIRLAIQVLSRRMKNNPIIIGEPGVGKTAIVEGLALRIARGDVPDDLKSAAILDIDMGQLIAGAKFRGEFEERFKRVLQEVADAGNVIMFIDEIHMLIGAGGSEGAMDAANLIKPALSRGEIRCMGATTLEEYRKHIEKDAALMRRFQTIVIAEPTVEDTLSILRGIKEKYEVHHGVRVTDAALSAAAKLGHRYITDRFLPDKAIDLLDQTAAAVRIGLSSKPEEIDRIDRRIVQLEIEMRAIENEKEKDAGQRFNQLVAELDDLKQQSRRMTEKWEKEKKALTEVQQAQKALEASKREMEKAIHEENFSKVAELQYKVIPECEAVLAAYADVDLSDSRFLKEEITQYDVAETVSRWTGIPVSKMVASERDKLLHLENHLRRRVVGQEEALTTIAKAVRRSRAGVQDPQRPTGCFLMLGPTGVGKTELAKALAEFMFDDESALVRIDMSEFMEKHSAARLVGAPPGYVGYEEGGILTNKVKRKPYSVVLFDEVEKAHPDVFNLFLQLFDDGRLTDSQGQTVNFTNTIVLMTSNLGADRIEPAATEAENQAMNAAIMDAVRGHFRPEFLNRLDDIIVFRQLSPEAMQPIVLIQIDRLQKLLDERDIKLELSVEAVNLLAEKGFNPLLGARPLKRVIQSRLQDPIAEMILDSRITEKQTIHIDAQADELILQPNGDTTPAPIADAEVDPDREPKDSDGTNAGDNLSQ